MTANRAEGMMERLEKEQEMVKALLPATVPHPSIKNWVTKQMVCVRFVEKLGHKKQKEKRVLCLTPTTLFLCHIVGEVRRFIKLSQVEAAVAGHTGTVEQLLIKCSAPEHDVLVNFTSDAKNDPKEKPMTFLMKLEKVKNLRGEFFPVDRRRGDLFSLANLDKHPKYVPPKKRIDKAKHKPGEDPYYESYDQDAAHYIQSLGEKAGRMGATERPAPPTRTTFTTAPPIQSMSAMSVAPASPPPTKPANTPHAPHTTGPTSFNESSQHHRHQEIPGYPATYPARQSSAYSTGGGGGPAYPPPQQQYNTPTPTRLGGGGVGYTTAMQQNPGSGYTSASPQGYSQGPGYAQGVSQQSYTQGQRVPSQPAYSPGYSQGVASYSQQQPGVSVGEVPRLHFHATSIPTAAEDMVRWEQRNIAADVAGAPRPEDLGWVSGRRAPMPPKHQAESYQQPDAYGNGQGSY